MTAGGSTAIGFERVAAEFARLLATGDDASGQFCAYAGGRLVADLWGGDGVGPDDLQGVFSSTKGVAAVCVALLVQRGALDLDAPVSRYWPEFAGGGKGGVTVRLALSHQAGLPGVEPQLSFEQLIEHDLVAARLAAQVPHWRPGAAHGYHALTIGTIMDELVRRVAGVPVAEFFRQEIGQPRGIDVYIRTPERLEHRVRMLRPPRPPDGYRPPPGAPPPAGPDSLPGMAFNQAAPPSGQAPEGEPLPNLRALRASGQAAVAGTGSARGLARLYAMCIGEVDGFPRLLSEATVVQFGQLQVAGDDLVLREPTRFGIVFEKADDHKPYGSHQAFGHDGAGGSLGFADPWHDVAYAWIPRRMSFPAGADPRGLTLARLVRECRLRTSEYQFIFPAAAFPLVCTTVTTRRFRGSSAWSQCSKTGSTASRPRRRRPTASRLGRPGSGRRPPRTASARAAAARCRCRPGSPWPSAAPSCWSRPGSSSAPGR
jgi:CubicO group peptidase (beta-lactamase class C family)